MEYINELVLIAAGATTLAVQILKSKIIPIPFQNYPVVTNVVVSLIAAVATVGIAGVDLNKENWEVLLTTFIKISLVAALVYNQLLGNSHLVKATEAPKTIGDLKTDRRLG